MVICEKCKKVSECYAGQMFLELNKGLDINVPECETYEEKKPEFKIIKGGQQ